MFFGRIPVAEAEGAIVGHTLRLGGGAVLKKGTVLGAREIEALRAAGYAEVIGARLDGSDVPEDRAADEVARAIAGSGVRLAEAATGRCNLHAEADGVLCVDRDRIDRLNLRDEAVTVATIAPHAPVRAGDMVATVKIIPFAAPRATIEACAAIAERRAITIAPFVPWSAGLVLTRLPGTKESVLDRAAGAQRVRAERLGGRIAREIRCAHDEEAVAAVLREMLAAEVSPILLLGASAIVDRRDVIPAAIERAGGSITHLGMPVDPGNLMLLAKHGPTPILGVPGCARSLTRSGYDMVLERLAARLPVTSADVMTMGVGGLLGEIPTRPFPRDGDEPAPEPAIAAIVLAAGRSSRMGERNKLLVEVDGAAMITHIVDAILATSVRPVVVVTGHDEDAVRAALGGREVIFVHNARWTEGMSTSLRAGIGQLGEDIDGALVCLGDMPRVRPAHLEALLGAFDPAGGRSICVPTWERRRGNPVLFARRHFAEMRVIEGDVGARALIEKHASAVCPVPMPDRGVTLDVDTPEALEALSRSAI
ncbi:MAG: molybdopterin-binding/glycosyltransferase family 2 protein [Minicystis sp.]